MPSLQNVADQLNARLDLIATNTANTAENTADNLVVSKDIRSELIQANNQLLQIDNTLAVGFSNLSQGISTLIQVQLAALNLLDHHRKQNDTIICELVNNNELLCNIMNKLGNQLGLSEATLISVKRIEGITERVYCCEVNDYDRDLDHNRRIEECCPPEPICDEKCPDVCKVPKYRETKPSGQDWKPLSTPKNSDLVG